MVVTTVLHFIVSGSQHSSDNKLFLIIPVVCGTGFSTDISADFGNDLCTHSVSANVIVMMTRFLLTLMTRSSKYFPDLGDPLSLGNNLKADSI